jgi:hypothetical protein
LKNPLEGGQAPIAATVYELERLRCNLCGEIFEAAAPASVGEKKYDETAAAMIALMNLCARNIPHFISLSTNGNSLPSN